MQQSAAAAAVLLPLKMAIVLLLGGSPPCIAAAAPAVCDASADVVVWGGTVCGVTASVAAARGNSTVLWLVNGSRLGGMTSGGLGGVDLGMIIGGLANELLTPLGRGFEPHVAEEAMQAMVATAGDAVKIHRGTGWLASVSATGLSPRRISSATALDGRTYCGLVFIDCSYEGDLTRLSGTKYTVGRESAVEYNESMAGDDAGSRVGNETDLTEKASFFAPGVSPWLDSSNTTLLPTITGVEDATKTGGQGDGKVMAMCFRMCLTNNASNSLPIGPPPGYSTDTLELLRRELISASEHGCTPTYQPPSLSVWPPTGALCVAAYSSHDVGILGHIAPRMGGGG